MSESHNGKLSVDELRNLYNVAIESDLFLYRDALLVGLSPFLQARLPKEKAQDAQLWSDLNFLNQSASDGEISVGLVGWLRSAEQFATQKKHKRVFRDYLSQIANESAKTIEHDQRPKRHFIELSNIPIVIEKISIVIVHFVIVLFIALIFSLIVASFVVSGEIEPTWLFTLIASLSILALSFILTIPYFWPKYKELKVRRRGVKKNGT